MNINFLLIGILVGFAMAVPLGPLGILCIRKTLARGLLQGFIIGVGAATSDMLYSSVAAFGLTAIADGLESHRILIRILGGLLLFFLGVKTYRTKPRNPEIPINNNGIIKSYIYSLGITLTNPFTIFAFIAVFTAFNLAEGITAFSSSALITGIFLGSSLWFLVLSSGVTLFRKKVNISGLKWANRIAGIMIFISGIITVGSI